jgi:hypothetical protein
MLELHRISSTLVNASRSPRSDLVQRRWTAPPGDTHQAATAHNELDRTAFDMFCSRTILIAERTENVATAVQRCLVERLQYVDRLRHDQIGQPTNRVRAPGSATPAPPCRADHPSDAERGCSCRRTHSPTSGRPIGAGTAHHVVPRNIAFGRRSRDRAGELEEILRPLLTWTLK